MKPLKIVHLLPDLLNLYGDGGNVKCLAQRCFWRDIPVEVAAVYYGDRADLSDADIVFLGGGPDREQKLASEQLFAMKAALLDYIESDGVLLAICGGYQVLGHEWLLADESVEGLGLIDAVTKRPDGDAYRLIDDIALESPLASHPVIGYENHAGRTYLGQGMKPFGKVISATGFGNNDTDSESSDGIWYRGVIGSYLHGPLLSKNPEVTDYLLQSALSRRAGEGEDMLILPPLDDAVEHAANDFMADRLGIQW